MRRTGWHVHAYVGGMAALTAYALDEWLDLRKWRRVSHAVPLHDSERLVVGLRARTRPPPIGAMDWPGGRTLLQWVLDVEELDAADGAVLEIGSGIGLTAIGLALARNAHEARGVSTSSRAVQVGDSSCDETPVASSAVKHATESSSTSSRAIHATDACDETLKLLRENAEAHALPLSALRVSKWDAAAGTAALASLPVAIDEISHVIGSDVIYHGFGEEEEAEAEANGRGLERTLSALLRAKPNLNVRLLAVDRFSGGAVAALSGAAGVNVTSPAVTVDPAITEFVRRCEGVGLAVERCDVPPSVQHRVASDRGWLAWIFGNDEGMIILKVTLAGPVRPPGRRAAG